jgi:hypothetical protein
MTRDYSKLNEKQIELFGKTILDDIRRVMRNKGYRVAFEEAIKDVRERGIKRDDKDILFYYMFGLDIRGEQWEDFLNGCFPSEPSEPSDTPSGESEAAKAIDFVLSSPFDGFPSRTWRDGINSEDIPISKEEMAAAIEEAVNEGASIRLEEGVESPLEDKDDIDRFALNIGITPEEIGTKWAEIEIAYERYTDTYVFTYM